jgi:MoxR-like ATPase
VAQTLAAAAERIRAEVAKVVVGQEAVVERLLVAALTRGHVLLEGVPGTAKTLITKALAICLRGEFKRVQFTPDLMPSDVIGTTVFDLQSGSFHLRKGPVFTNFLLADEVNRTPPKTQAALLEAMEERQVTIDGTTHVLQDPFVVFATQNPIEYEGTYPLPEAQLDRFLLKVRIDYPSEQEEVRLLGNYHRGFDPHRLDLAGVQPVVEGPDDLAAWQASVQGIVVSDDVLAYIARIVRQTRQLPNAMLGGSPRASIALLLGSKTLAALRGRAYVIPDDIKDLAHDALRHRIILRPEAEIEGITTDAIVDEVLDKVPVPR